MMSDKQRRAELLFQASQNERRAAAIFKATRTPEAEAAWLEAYEVWEDLRCFKHILSYPGPRPEVKAKGSIGSSND